MENSRFRDSLNQIYFSSSCRCFYLALIIASVTVCVWTLIDFGKFPDNAWFIGLEAVLTVAVLTEVVMRMYLQGTRTFLMNWMNLFDLAVIVFSFLALLGALIGVLGDVGGLSGQGLVIFYCCVQYLRLALFLKNRSQTNVQDIEILTGYQNIALTSPKKAHLGSFSSED